MRIDVNAKRIVFSLVLLVLFVLLGFVARGGITLHPYPLEDFSSDTAYLVLEAVSEDAVKIQYKGRLTIVKLLGVGTPITAYLNLSVDPLKEKTALLMRDLLLGEFVYLRFDTNKLDANGQLWAYFYRAPDGLFINLELIRQGYNRVNTQFLFQYRELFQYYEQRAQGTGKGRWYGITQKNIRKSTGYDDSDADQIVYVTRAKTKYHRDGCRFLVSHRPIKLAEAKKKNYKPCLLCNPAH